MIFSIWEDFLRFHLSAFIVLLAWGNFLLPGEKARPGRAASFSLLLALFRQTGGLCGKGSQWYSLYEIRSHERTIGTAPRWSQCPAHHLDAVAVERNIMHQFCPRRALRQPCHTSGRSIFTNFEGRQMRFCMLE